MTSLDAHPPETGLWADCGEWPDQLFAIAGGQRGALSGSQLREFLDPPRLTRAVRNGRLIRLWWDAYALPGCENDLDTRLAAADFTLGLPAAACLETAAALHGFDLSEDRRLHLLAPGSANGCRRIPLVLHRDRILTPMVRIRDRLVTSPAETAIGLAARQRGGPQALAILDAALRFDATTRPALADVAAISSLNNIRKVRALVPLANAAAESPAESRLRWHVYAARLPAPAVQYSLIVQGTRYRIDLAWPEHKVAAEYDGVAWHIGDRLFADRARINALQRAGWVIVFVTADMLRQGRPAFLDHLAALLCP